MKTSLTILALSLSVMISACGGGGADDDLGFSLSASSVTFLASHDSPAPDSKIININVTSGEIYFMVNTDAMAFGTATFTVSGSTTGVVEVMVPSPELLGIGEHNTSFEVLGCADPFCDTTIQRKQISIRYIVDEWGTVTPNPVTVKGIENLLGGTASVTLDPGTSTANWSLDAISVVYLDTNTGWLNIAPHSGSFTGPQSFDFSTSVMPRGVYSANLIFAGQRDGVPFKESSRVNYTSGSPINLSTSTINVNPSTVVGDLVSSISVDLAPIYSGAPIAFNVFLNNSWLSVSPTSGDTSTVQSLSITIDETQLASMKNGENIVTISLQPTDTSLATATTSVTLDMQLPTVTAVTPNVTYLGEQEELILRGLLFDTVTTPTVTFGGVAASSVTVVSNTEIRALPQPIASAGSSHVAVGSSVLGIDRGNDFYIADSVAWPEGQLARSNGSPTRVVLDQKRRFIYIVDSTLNGFRKYAWDGSAWALSSVGISSYPVADLALMPDDSALVVAIDVTKTIDLFDPDTGGFLDSFGLGEYGNTCVNSFNNLIGIAATNTNKLIVTTDSTYSNSPIAWLDLASKTLSCSTFDPYQGRVTISDDGHRALVIEGGIYEPRVWIYSASSDTLEQLTDPGPNHAFALSGNRRGDRVVMIQPSITTVFDGAMNRIGDIPDGYYEVVLSPDGNKAYAHVEGSTSIDVFDTGTAVGLDETFTKLSTIELGASPGTKPHGAITGDGKTIVLVGGSKLVVTTLP